MLGHQLHSREVVDVEVVADGCAAAAYAAGGVPVGCCVCVGGAVWCWKKELFAPLPLKTFVCPLCFDCSWRGCAALGGEG